MKILHINSIGYEAGGTETGIIRLKKELVKKGHEVKILSSDFSAGKQLFSDFQFTYTKNSILNPLFRLFNPHSYVTTKKILAEYKPDIIHLHRMDYISPSTLFLLRKHPTIMTIHGPEDFIKSLLIWFMPHSYFNKKTISKKNLNLKGRLHYIYHVYFQMPIYKIALKRVDHFVTLSQYFSSTLDQNIRPVTTIYNGINVLKFSKKEKCDYKLLYVGRLDKTKGVDYLIKALPKILKKFPKTTLSIVGEGIFKDELLDLTKKLKLEKNIIFVPWQKSEDVKNYYKAADVMVVPSIWPEAFGKVGPEAMSVGRPVVGTRVGGIPEWITDGKTGFLVAPRNAHAIAEKVITLLSNKNLRENMGLDASKKAKEFSMQKHANKIEKLYETIISKYKS